MARGTRQDGRWGAEPWSDDPRRVERITGIARDDEIWLAEVDGRPAGVMAVAPRPPPYVVAIDDPELSITLLVTDRAFAGRGVGGALIGKAKDEALAKGVRVLRVDCYGGGDARLVEHYRRNGFETAAEFTVGDWPGRLLSQPTGGEAPHGLQIRASRRSLDVTGENGAVGDALAPHGRRIEPLAPFHRSTRHPRAVSDFRQRISGGEGMLTGMNRNLRSRPT